MIAKVSISFIEEENDPDLLVSSGRILAAMTGNASFATPDPSLASVGAARTTFLGAVNNLGHGTGSTVLRDQARAPFEALMRDLALYVQKTANGDLAVLLSSGFPAQKSRQPVGELPAPANVRLRRPEMSGQLKARCAPNSHAATCQWRYATSLAPTAWTLLDPTTGASTTLENLTPGTTYVVQARYIGSAGPSDWSDPAMLMAV